MVKIKLNNAHKVLGRCPVHSKQLSGSFVENMLGLGAGGCGDDEHRMLERQPTLAFLSRKLHKQRPRRAQSMVAINWTELS